MHRQAGDDICVPPPQIWWPHVTTTRRSIHLSRIYPVSNGGCFQSMIDLCLICLFSNLFISICDQSNQTIKQSITQSCFWSIKSLLSLSLSFILFLYRHIREISSEVEGDLIISNLSTYICAQSHCSTWPWIMDDYGWIMDYMNMDDGGILSVVNDCGVIIAILWYDLNHITYGILVIIIFVMVWS